MTDQQEYNRKLIDDFRTTRAEKGVPLDGRSLLLLTTIGAKSGQNRTTPIMYIPDNDRYIVFASNAGAPCHPDWYHNLAAHPEVTVEVGSETFDGKAVVAEGAERQRLWTMATAAHHFFAEHQAKVTRQIPVIILERR